MADVGGVGALAALPKLPTDGLAQDAGSDDPAEVLIELLEQLELLGGEGQMLPVFSYFRLLQVYRVRLGPFLGCPVPTGLSGIYQRGRGDGRHDAHLIPDECLSAAHVRPSGAGCRLGASSLGGSSLWASARES